MLAEFVLLSPMSGDSCELVFREAWLSWGRTRFPSSSRWMKAGSLASRSKFGSSRSIILSRLPRVS